MPLSPYCLLLLAALSASVSAAPFSITTNSSTAQEAGAGAVAAGASLTVAGPTAAVTMSGRRATFSNFGSVAQTGTGHAILARSGAGLVITNGSRSNATALIEATDSEAIQAKPDVSGIAIHNFGTVVSHNVSGKGSQALDLSDVAGTNTVNNHERGELRATDADAVRPGKQGIVVNAGKIVSLVKSSAKNIAAIDAQSHTGIRVTNASGGLIDGARHAITGGRKDDQPFTMTVNNEAGAIIRGKDGAGLNFDGIGAGQVITVRNHGSILGTGLTGDGDGVDVDGLVDITNTGVIRSVNAFSKNEDGPAFSEGISAGGGTIVNAGTIEGLVAAGNTNAVGRAISLVGNNLKRGKPGEREGIYANTRVVNQRRGMIRSASESAIVAAGNPNAFTITIDNQAGATIEGGGTSEAALRSTSNRTSITNAGTIDGAASNKAIQFGQANNTLIVQGGSAVIKGAIDGGPGGGNTMVVDAGAGRQFAYAGTIARFDTLDVKTGNARLSGQLSFKNKTVVSGGTLTLVGAQPIAPGSALVLAGGILNVAGTGPAGQAFASLSLEGDAVIESGRAALSFARVGNIEPGKTLKLSGPLQFIGDQGRDANFQALLRVTRIGDGAVTASFDGRYTNVTPASTPGRLARAEQPRLH
ncbi:PEP-CTERM sorting domain-containing protein [Massilia sp. S19_KUP03_FR1]|uniref:PEP-CTERM sorting domain-containing protein n=1 Tax=Massilia sp. S19_KUP03_FR1 TaxID=3025503 RepID=UPI002FCDC9AD